MLTATPCLKAQQTTQATQQALVINEIMQSNIDCIMDDKKEFPDSWVELYNNSDGAIQLKGYRLGITTVADDAYQLPSRNIQPRDSCWYTATGRRQACTRTSDWSRARAATCTSSRERR